jgi:hypothetical protein
MPAVLPHGAEHVTGVQVEEQTEVAADGVTLRTPGGLEFDGGADGVAHGEVQQRATKAIAIERGVMP